MFLYNFLMIKYPPGITTINIGNNKIAYSSIVVNELISAIKQTIASKIRNAFCMYTWIFLVGFLKRK